MKIHRTICLISFSLQEMTGSDGQSPSPSLLSCVGVRDRAAVSACSPASQRKDLAGRGTQRDFCLKPWCCPLRLKGMYCHSVLQQALPHLGGIFSCVLSVLTPGKEKTGRDKSHCLSLPSAHGVTNDTGIPFTDPRCSHGITSAHQGYTEISNLNFSYAAYCVSTLILMPYLLPRAAGCAELSPADTQHRFQWMQTGGFVLMQEE